MVKLIDVIPMEHWKLKKFILKSFSLSALSSCTVKNIIGAGITCMKNSLKNYIGFCMLLRLVIFMQNISQIAIKICATECFFTNHLKQKA